MLKGYKKNRGFSLLETMIAVAIIGIAIAGPYFLINSVISGFADVKNKFEAVFLAQEGMEIVRNIRDNNFIDIVRNGGAPSLGLAAGSCYEADYNDTAFTPCDINNLRQLKINNEGFYNYDSGTNTIFRRYIQISNCGADCVQVRSVVLWNFRGEQKQYELVGKLYNWIKNYVPVP